MKNTNIILVIIDGLNACTAEVACGFLNALVEDGKAAYTPIRCALPSMSRPLYETILTGYPPVQSGVVHNSVSRLSYNDSVFSLAKKNGLSTAAAAYYWVSELYVKAPFNHFEDRLQLNPLERDIFTEGYAIDYGIYYDQDDYPDQCLLQDAEFLRRTYRPNFLLVHTMGVDNAGHLFGGDSSQYQLATRKVDGILSALVMQWLEEGYQIIVTADHGMSWDKNHGGTTEKERLIPFFTIGSAFKRTVPSDLLQTQIAASICAGFGISHPLNNAADLWQNL